MSKVYKATVATTDPIAGRNVRIPEQELYQIAEHIRSGRIPIRVDHDPRKRLYPHILQAEVYPTEHGTLALRVMYELSDEDAEACEGKCGFSISLTEPFRLPDVCSRGDKPLLTLVVGSSHFDDDTFETAVRELVLYFSLDTRYLHRFSPLPPPQVIVDIGVSAAGGVISSTIVLALVAACKKFLKSKDGQQTIITFKKGETEVRLQTADAEVLQKAIEKAFELQSAPTKSARKKTNS